MKVDDIIEELRKIETGIRHNGWTRDLIARAVNDLRDDIERAKLLRQIECPLEGTP